MNEGLGGSNGVDHMKCVRRARFAGRTLVKITVDVRGFVAEQCVTEAKALEKAMEDKLCDFVRKGVAPKHNI
jgi:hypothetical protein